jgi:hypothetical protein
LSCRPRQKTPFHRPIMPHSRPVGRVLFVPAFSHGTAGSKRTRPTQASWNRSSRPGQKFHPCRARPCRRRIAGAAD